MAESAGSKMSVWEWFWLVMLALFIGGVALGTFFPSVAGGIANAAHMLLNEREGIQFALWLAYKVLMAVAVIAIIVGIVIVTNKKPSP